MKHLALILVIILGSTGIGLSQKYGYVNTNYILEQVPEYAEAQEEINTISKEWQEEISLRKNTIEEKTAAFKAEEILLPEETKKSKLAELDLLKKQEEPYKNNGLVLKVTSSKNVKNSSSRFKKKYLKP